MSDLALRGGPGILIVDDERSLRFTIGEALRGEGFRVFEAPGGESALVQLREEEIDLVLLDQKLKESGEVRSAQISLAKWNNVRTALDIARDCRDLLGAAGITLDLSPMRHMLNLETVITYEGTESIHELIVGRDLTGHNAF